MPPSRSLQGIKPGAFGTSPFLASFPSGSHNLLRNVIMIHMIFTMVCQSVPGLFGEAPGRTQCEEVIRMRLQQNGPSTRIARS